MKMSSIFKKASIFAIAVTMALLMVVSVLPAVFAADATENTGFGEKLAATNISVSGGITMQYYFTGVDDAVEVKVTYPLSNGKFTTETRSAEELKQKDGRYLVEIPIAFAQQTEKLTIQWVTVNEQGVKVPGKKFERTARDYADLVFKYAELDLEKYPQYTTTKANAQAMVPMVTYMLNAGAQAQIQNKYKVDEDLPLANEGLFAADTNPIDNMLADHFYDVDKRTEHDTAGTGVTFTGTQVFLTSKVNLRVYLTCPDSIETAKVYRGDKYQEVYIKTETTGSVTRKYVGINNIVPTDFNTRFVVEIGDAKFEYSVLDYAYNAVESPFATQEMKDTAKSLYLFYTYTREYTAPKDVETGKPTYVVGPKEKDEEGKIVVNEATGMPQAATKVDESGNTVIACEHTRAYSNNTTIVCPDCGYTYEKEIIQILASAIKSEGIEQGKNTGKLTISYAIAGNTEFTGLLIVPNLPEGISWSVDSVRFFDGIEGEIMRNCEIDTTVPFSTGKIVEVTYLIDATNAKAGANQITFRLVQATDKDGELVSDETLAGVLTTTVQFDVLPQKCAEGTHAFKYSIDGENHYSICTKCYEYTAEVPHTYASKVETVGGKLVYSYGACECGAVKVGENNYTYDIGFTLDADGNKTTKAPLLVLTPSDIKNMSTTRVDKGDITTTAEGSYITLKDSATSGEGYINFFSGNNKYGVTGQYLMIKYRTTHAKNTQIFFGANNGHTGAYGGDNFYLTPGSKSLVANGEWQTLILDLNQIGASYFKAETEGDNVGKFMADYIRWDVFDTNPTGSEQSVDVAYIAMSDDIMSLASFAGNDIYTACTTSGTVGSLFCAIGSYMASTKTLNPFFNASWIDQSYNNYSEVNINEAVDTANGGLHYAEITRASSSTATDRYMFLMGSSNPGASKIIAPTTKDAKYAAIMYRKHVDTGSSKRFQLLLHSTSTGMDGKGTVNFTTNYHIDGDWHLTVASLSSASIFDPTVGLKSIRFDYHDAGIADGDTNLTDIAFVAFFSSQEEAYEYMREYTQKYLTVEGGQGCTHDVTTKSTADCCTYCVYCDAKTAEAAHTAGTEWTPVITEGATKLYEQTTCTVCGGTATTRSLPIKSWHNATFCDSTKVIGSIAMGKVDDTEYTVKNTVKVNGWLAINGGGVLKYVYRITDGNGNVGAWTEALGSAVDTSKQNLMTEVAKNPDVQDWNHKSDFTDSPLYTEDLQSYWGQTIKVEFAAIPASNPGTETNPNTHMIVTLNKVKVECDHARNENVYVLNPSNPKQLISDCSVCGAENITKTATVTQTGKHVFIPGINLGNSSNVITEENGFSYLRLKASNTPDGGGEDRVKIYGSATPIANAGRYVAVLWRSNIGNLVQLGMDNSSGIKTGVNNVGSAPANTWTFKVIKYNDHSSYTLEHGPGNVTVDYFNGEKRTTDDYADIAFIAFFENEQDAYDYFRIYLNAYIGAENCQHDKTYVDTNDDCTVKCYCCNKVMSDVQHGKTYVDTNDGCAVKCYYCNKAMGDVQHGETSWQFISNAGTEFAGTRYAVEGKTCNGCGKVLETRNAVISVNFDNFLVATEDGTDSRYSWGSRGTPVTDPTKRHFSLYSSASTSGDGLSGTKYTAPTFLRSSGAIGGSGWAGINGLFTETSYYRILDKDGNVLVDWTAIANSRGEALAANNGVVTTAKGQLESCGIETDPRRFNMGTIDLSKYAHFYGQGDPISLEYALQAEGAPAGSDLILAVRIDDIYTNCVEHTFKVVYEDQNGVRIGTNKCTNCGFVKGSHSITLGNKAPNLFMGAQDIAGRLSSATNMSKTGVLSNDGSYVTISNTANKGDGYFNLLNGNKTVTGRYMVIKYRTTYDGTWQFYTSSNSATPSAGQTSGDGFCLYTYRADSITGGVINDGNWNYAIFDLAGLNPNAFKAYEDGSYMAQFFRWDIFDSSRASATVDVAFVAFSDDLKALTGMDNIVTYDYAFAKSGTTAAVLPMSNTVGDNNPFFDAISLAGKGSAKSGTLLTDEANGNMPYAQFTATSTSEQHFMLWNNTGYMLSGSGKYVGILYRSPKATQMEIFVNSTSGGAQSGCNKQEGITADNEWHFIYVDVSKFKSGSHYYDESKGLGSFRFDFMNAGHAADSTIDVAFVGFFDGADDMTATLSAYYDMYGIQVDTTAIGVKSPETSINANDSFSVTVSGVKGAFTSGTITLSGIPTDAVVESYVLGAGVTGTIDGTTITITAIDNTVFDGTIATLTLKTTYKTAGGDYTVGVTTNIVNGEGKVTAKFSGTTAITVVAHECTFGAYEFTSTQHYQTCTVCGEVIAEDHTIGNTTATEIDGVMNYVTGCTVCEWNFSKLTADATKAPLVVYSAKQIHSVLKANTSQHSFFQGFELIQDENGAGFVRITSNGSNGDPYAYVYKPSTVTETGRYLTIRYRIPASNSGNTTMLQVFASTTNGGMNGNDTSGNIFPVAKQSDNEWRTLVIDLTQNGTTYTAAEDGTYSAKYVRIDFFGNAGNKDGDYVDIQFIAFSDKLNTNVSDGVTKFSENTYYFVKSTGTVHDFDQFNGLMSWLGDEKLGGQYIVTDANGITYNKYISKNASEQNIYIYQSASNPLKPVSDYIAIIYRAPKTVMINGTRTTNKVGGTEYFVHSSKDTAQGGASKMGTYTVDGTWKVLILDLSAITTAYDPTTGLVSLRIDYFNTNATVTKGSELHIAAIGFVENAAAGTAWYNEFIKAYYPDGQTEYVTDDVCADGQHTNFDGWTPATADDGTLIEQKICFSCGHVMEERNVWYRGWINGVYYNGTADANKVTSDGANAYYGSSNKALDLGGVETAATTVTIKGWFAINGGTSAYYYRVNGGEWIKITDCSLAAANSGITGDVDKQGMGIANYSTNALFNGHLTTGDLTVDYAGQTITIELGACPTNNPGTEDAPNVISFKTFTNVQIAG